MLVREIRSLEILSVKKEAKLSAREVTEVEEGFLLLSHSNFVTKMHHF